MKNQSKVRYRTFQLRPTPAPSPAPTPKPTPRPTPQPTAPRGAVGCGVGLGVGFGVGAGDGAGVGLSWKVRYRTLLWFFIQMIKLYKARSLLYRRQILQENIRWKALDEIYKIYMLLHRSDLNISEFFRQTFSHFLDFLIFFAKFVIFEFFSLIFAQILMKFCRNFADTLDNVENFRNFWIF